MIRKFATKQDYNSAEKSTNESDVSLVTAGNEVMYDGVNVITDEPTVGDFVFKDGANKVYYIKAATLNTSLINQTWTHVGYVYARFGKAKLIVDKNETSLPYAGMVQFILDAPTLDGNTHNASIGVRVAGGTSAGFDANTVISFSYASTTLSGVVAALNSAIESAKASQGFVDVLWAYLCNDNYEKVDSDAQATKIMVQLDAWRSYQQHACSGMTHVTWRDMPEISNAGFRGNYIANNTRIMNDARGAAYYGSNGVTPSAAVPLNAVANPVTRAAFTSSEYCQLLRDTYGTYENYIRKEYHVVYPQKLGVFSLPDGVEQAQKYGNISAPSKDGGVRYLSPALHYGLTVGYGNGSLATGKWHLPSVEEGSIFMDDDTLNAIAASAQKIGASVPNNSTLRWFAERHYVYHAWIFHGFYGNLEGFNVGNAFACRAVTLLDD